MTDQVTSELSAADAKRGVRSEPLRSVTLQVYPSDDPPLDQPGQSYDDDDDDDMLLKKFGNKICWQRHRAESNKIRL